MKHIVHRRDARGRPVDVTFDGNPAAQCPSCLSREVEALRAVVFVPVSDNPESDDFAAVRRMRCRDCRARWWRTGP